jgi:hypothetical protein
MMPYKEAFFQVLTELLPFKSVFGQEWYWLISPVDRQVSFLIKRTASSLIPHKNDGKKFLT